MRSSFKAAGWKDPAALHRQARAIHSAGAPENLTQLPFLYQKGAEWQRGRPRAAHLDSRGLGPR